MAEQQDVVLFLATDVLDAVLGAPAGRTEEFAFIRAFGRLFGFESASVDSVPQHGMHQVSATRKNS